MEVREESGSVKPVNDIVEGVLRVRKLNKRLQQQLYGVREFLAEADCEDRQTIVNGCVGHVEVGME